MTEVHASHSLGGGATSYYTAVCYSATPPSIGTGFSQICIMIPNGLKEGLAGTPACYKQQRGPFYCGRKTVNYEFGLCSMLHTFFLYPEGIKHVFGKNLYSLLLHELSYDCVIIQILRKSLVTVLSHSCLSTVFCDFINVLIYLTWLYSRFSIGKTIHFVNYYQLNKN